ncbi:hypothetical protein AYM39_11100 [Methylomonas sp. DH-1]|nr:hypothetical protein AYM39_11045 [Methylomonas sp. DH-1]ANE55670.1 hypothetical protein AYM39_11100 [Methylomonas sp. DH-1]
MKSIAFCSVNILRAPIRPWLVCRLYIVKSNLKPRLLLVAVFVKILPSWTISSAPSVLPVFLFPSECRRLVFSFSV